MEQSPKMMPDLFTAVEGAREGMRRAVEHADRVELDWSVRAYGYFRQFARGHRRFLTEDARAFAHNAGLERPPDSRAWGAVTNRAARLGIISEDGMERSRFGPAHSRPMTAWRSNIFRGDA